MPIAIGDEVHDDELSYAAKQAGISIKPVEEEKPSTPSATSVGSPEKPAGESIPQEGTGVAPLQTPTTAPSNGFTDAEGMIHPTPDYMNPPEHPASFRPSAVGIITKTLKDAWEAFKAPGEATQGKLPMWAVNPETGEVNTSIQAIEKAHNLASLMTTGPAPVAKNLADGTLGSFMGVRSKTINKEELYRAQNMEMGGTHPDEIYRETGNFRGADGRWRQEISDAESSLRKENLDHKEATSGKGWTDLGNQESVGIKSDRPYDLPNKPTAEDWTKWERSLAPQKPTLVKDILDHPELIKAYPDVGNIKLKNLNDYDPHGVSGLDLKNVGGIHMGDTIYMKNAHPDQFHSVLLHEIQHHIQDIEGFARGGNPGQFLPAKLAPAEAKLKEAQEWFEKEAKAKGVDPDLHRGAIEAEHSGLLEKLPKDVKEGAANLIKDAKEKGVYQPLKNLVQAERLLKDAKYKAHTEYERLMGEVEARNVQARMHQDWLEQLNNPPRKTEDVPRFAQKHSDDVEGHSAVSAAQEGPGIVTPYSQRWPHNDNMKPLNEHQQFIQDYDALHAFGQKMNPKSETDIHKYNQMGRAMMKRNNFGEWTDVEFDPLNLRGLKK